MTPMDGGVAREVKSGDKCHICDKALEAGNKLHMDHCHKCGKIRGMVHAKCNMGYKVSRDVVVAMHNLKHYDGHFIMTGTG